jgi:uncharacterized membrane protein
MPYGGSGARVGGHPIHPMLVPFPIAFLIGGLVSDIIFVGSRAPFWSTAAYWLIGAALVMGALAAIAGLIDFVTQQPIRTIPDAWYHLYGNVAAMLLAAVNFWLRHSLGYAEAVLPWGIALSAIVAGILLYTGWLGGELVFRHQCGMIEEAPQKKPGK